MADTLIREAVQYSTQPLSPVPQYWDGTSYAKVQGINGASRVIIYDSAGETFTDANPASVTVVSSAGGTAVLNSSNPGIVEVVLSAGGTATFSNSNPANVLVITSAGGSAVLSNTSPAFVEVVSSSGGTAYFSSANPGFSVNKPVGSANNTWSASVSVSAGSTSTAVDLQYNYNISYFGEITNTASLTLSLQISQDNSNWYTAANNTITAGTSSPFHYATTTGARYARLEISGVSATITAMIAGK